MIIMSVQIMTLLLIIMTLFTIRIISKQSGDVRKHGKHYYKYTS